MLTEGIARIVVIVGPDLGRLITPVDGLIIGRGSSAGFQIREDDSVSRQHCALGKSDDGWVVRDLNSTSGTWINDERVDRRLLIHGDRISVGQTVLKYLDTRDSPEDWHGYNPRIVDGLTGARTKRGLMVDIEAALGRPGTTALVAMNLLRFKRVNDFHGYVVGDHILRDVAHLLMRSVGVASVYRYAGDEFAVLLDDADHDVATDVARTLAQLINEHHFAVEDSGRVEIAVGYGVELQNARSTPPTMLDGAAFRAHDGW